MQLKRKPIVVELDINKEVGAVWNAITEHYQMVKWFFENIPAFEAKVGFETEFLIENEERKFTHVWKIEEIIPQQKIVYKWSYREYPGEGLVVFELIKKDSTTRLKLTNLGLNTFPKDVPEFSEENCYGGWKYFTNRLKEYLEGSMIIE